MGKANRVKGGKAVKAPESVSKKNNKKDYSKLYTAIVAAIALFVVIVIVATTIASSGITMRNSKAMYTENYTVNGNMLKYMFLSDYQEFLNTYSYYTSMLGLDTTKPLASQQFSDSAASLLGSFEGTWKDYFMSDLKTQAEQLLVYCEEANKRGVTLDEDDMKEIDDALHAIEDTAAAYGYSVDSYLELNYGKGVKLKDIRAAFELSYLAAKVAEDIDADLMNGITDDEINNKYNGNNKTYNVKDYIFYTISVEYDDVAAEVIEGYDGETELTDEQKATVLEAYKEKIAEAKAKAEAFENYTTVESFKEAVLLDIAFASFDPLYDSEALADADKLSDEALEVVKDAMIEQLVKEVQSDAESADVTSETDGVFTAYGETVTENAAKAIDNVKLKLYDDLATSKDSFFSQNLKYDSEDVIPKWAFDEAEGIGDTKTLSFGDGSSEGEIENKSGYFDIDVYMLASDEYRDTTLAKNVAYMTFADEASAKKAIESFKSSANKDLAAFEATAKSHAAVTNGTFDNYLKGQLSYSGYETWLYDDATVIGSITETPLANAATNATEYAVFFYFEDGDEAWYIDVKNEIFVDDYQEFYDALTKEFPITVDEKVLDKIDV